MEKYLLDKLITVGGGITDNLINNPELFRPFPFLLCLTARLF
jgi:hypothetical protein